MAGGRVTVEARSSMGDLVVEARLLDSFLERFFGLAFRKVHTVGEPVILFPCSSIHTFFMRFRIDAFFVSSSGEVVKIIRNIPPNRIILPVKGARLVLETPAEKIYLPDIKNVFIPHLIENNP
ncbi:MAG: DUF192 domain-containing protein [Deltaproteobacteria bacterium]|nr:DUF192 domain-containing protein [Deltaproteobacteria bacterium]NIS77479.1 DUF192 domain-containing protein [Deltaproteobacteria bacterium]